MKELSENEIRNISGACAGLLVPILFPGIDLAKVTGIMPTLPARPCPIWRGKGNATPPVAKPGQINPSFPDFW